MAPRPTTVKVEQPEAEGNEPTATNEDRATAAKRKIFVVMRLAELQDRIKAFAAEREELSKALEGKATEFTPDLKKMRERRAYASMRLESLRAEQKALVEEKSKRSFPPTLNATLRWR